MHNKELADKQGLDQTTRDVIDKLHLLRELLEDKISLGNMKQEDIIQNYKDWFDNEKLLQKLWKFPQNEDYIKFWNHPACSCPKMDNNDAYPTGWYTMSAACCIHGKDGGIVEWK